MANKLECKSCGDAYRDKATLKGRPVRLNRHGICEACAEMYAEVAADDAERLANARRLVAAADRRRR